MGLGPNVGRGSWFGGQTGEQISLLPEVELRAETIRKSLAPPGTAPSWFEIWHLCDLVV